MDEKEIKKKSSSHGEDRRWKGKEKKKDVDQKMGREGQIEIKYQRKADGDIKRKLEGWGK